jgi:hypothetical protein
MGALHLLQSSTLPFIHLSIRFKAVQICVNLRNLWFLFGIWVCSAVGAATESCSSLIFGPGICLHDLCRNCLRSTGRMLIVSRMKGYLTLGWILLAVCALILVTACAENSAWGASYGGMQLQENGNPSVPSGSPPPGSGSVDYIPQGPF